MEYIERLNQFHKTTAGYALFAALELVLLYIFASISIDTANMWAYLACVLLIIGLIRNIVLLTLTIYRGKAK